jgi:YD repeat-containing protein
LPASRSSFGVGTTLEAVTDAAGGITRYGYDSQHRMTALTDARDITFLQNTYDANSRVCRQIQADSGTFLFYYITADRASLPESQQLLNEAAAGGPITHPLHGRGLKFSGDGQCLNRSPG